MASRIGLESPKLAREQWGVYHDAWTERDRPDGFEVPKRVPGGGCVWERRDLLQGLEREGRLWPACFLGVGQAYRF